MKRPVHLTTALPKLLREELGLKDSYHEKKDKRNGPATRKERRRAERTGKKTQKPAIKRNVRQYEEDDDDDDMLDEGDDDAGFGSELGDLDEEETKAPPMLKAAKTEQKPESKPEKPKGTQDPESDDQQEEEGSASRKVPKAVQDKLDADEAEIAALEKKLGMKKGKKLPKKFEEDGLDDLLGDLDDGSGDEGRKRKRETDEWLLNKRRKAQALQATESEDDEDNDLGSGKETDFLNDDDDEEAGLEDEPGSEDENAGDSEFGGFDEEDEQPAPKQKENPYVAPIPTPKESQPAKYIPPSLRASSNSESESLTRLRRQAQGQLNKLSEANLVSILAEFEKLYREYPRQNVTSTLISLLMGLICERSALQDTFMVLHAGFIAALYKVIGMDFGAELMQKIVTTLDAQGDEQGKFEGKEHLNLISLLSQLYNFHVIGHTLIFDYIRILLQDITEDNTELLLKVIKSMCPSFDLWYSD